MPPNYNVGSTGFTSRKPFVVTQADTTLPWSGGKKGEYFRCYLCGHKFIAGDVARWEYTNDVPGTGGNMMVCGACDATKDVLVSKWKELTAEYNSPKFWRHRARETAKYSPR